MVHNLHKLLCGCKKIQNVVLVVEGTPVRHSGVGISLSHVASAKSSKQIIHAVVL